MGVLIAGLVIFLGMHSIAIFSPDLRARALARFGPAAGKAREALASGLDDPDSEVRRAAGEALLAIGTP